MTVQRIREAAMFHFSRDGYEGASLAQIANDVGIRKASIYAHFNNKEEIFFSCLDEAMQSDIRFLADFIKQLVSDKEQDLLYELLVKYHERAEHDVVTMFCWRSLYFPAHVFKERVTSLSTEHIGRIGELLVPVFSQARQNRVLHSDIEIEQAIEAYLCLFDGLMIEYMHGGAERFQQRLHASWPIFCRGMFRETLSMNNQEDVNRHL